MKVVIFTKSFTTYFISFAFSSFLSCISDLKASVASDLWLSTCALPNFFACQQTCSELVCTIPVQSADKLLHDFPNMYLSLHKISAMHDQDVI